MSVPRMLLLTGTPPGDGSAGEIYLRDLCLQYPRGKICCYTIRPPDFGLPSRDLDWLPIAYGRPPRHYGFHRLGHDFGRFAVWQYAKRIRLPVLIEQAVQFGKQNEVEMVWAVLNNPTVIHMVRKVVAALKAQLVTLVWDPPEWLTMMFDFDRLSRRSLLREFGNVLSSSVRCGVMSEAMKAEFESRYGVESTILRHGIHPSKIKPPAKEPLGAKDFVIGFAGISYSGWQPLLSALSKLAWRIDGRNIILRLIGGKIDISAEIRSKAHIEHLGWRSSVEEVIDLISETDVAYLPYSFDEVCRTFVRLSFPSKLSTYLAAGRPVLFHGPEDSSVAHFFKRFPAGLCCHSLDELSIIECLYRFANDREFYANATIAGKEALDQELSLRVYLQRFAMLIGVEESELLSLTKLHTG